MCAITDIALVQIRLVADTAWRSSLDTLHHMSAAAPLLALLLSASPSSDALLAGRTAYEAFQLEGAQASFLQAAVSAETPAERAEAFLWLGVLDAEQGDFAAAKAHFADAVYQDNNVKAPPGLSPTIAQLVEEQRAAARVQPIEAKDVAIEAPPPWLLFSGGAVASLGVVALGGGALIGVQAVTQRDFAQNQAFQSDAISEYQKARQGAFWSNVLYGAGGVLVATGGGLAAASLLGAEGL